jgi:hypothetical protein
MSATTSGRGNTETTTDNDPMERLTSTARQAADTVGGVAGEVAARLPEAASTTRDALEEANRRVRAGSDETLKVVGAASLAFAAGLLFGGANRFLVMAALVPAALVGSEYAQRQSSATK